MSGFGDPWGNYWLGLEMLHQITGKETEYKMRVELTSWQGEMRMGEYRRFRVSSKSDFYRAIMKKWIRHNITDSNVYTNYDYNYKFTTYDKDNDS